MKMNQANNQTLEIPSDAVVELDLDQVPDTDIVFTCPHCGKSHAIDRRGAGLVLVISCTDCRQPITVPAVGDAPEKQTVAEKTRHKIKIVKKTRPRVAEPNPENTLLVKPPDIKEFQPITVLLPEGFQEKAEPTPENTLPVKPRGIKELQPIVTLLPEGFQEKQDAAQNLKLHVMMKVLGGLTCLIAVAAVILFWPRDSFELSRRFNGTEVFYTSAVSQHEVKRLGTYLVKSGFANGDKKSVEINKTGETYEFRVIPKGDLNEANVFALADGISGVFYGSPIKVYICDECFRERSDGNENRERSQRRLTQLRGEMRDLIRERDNEVQTEKETYEDKRRIIIEGLPRLEELRRTKQDIDRKILQARKDQASLEGILNWSRQTNTNQFRVIWVKDRIMNECETLSNAVAVVRAKYPSVRSMCIAEDTYDVYRYVVCKACKNKGNIPCPALGCRNGEITWTRRVECRGKSCVNGQIPGVGGLWMTCPRCNGTGFELETRSIDCSQCKGTAQVKCTACVLPTLIARVEKIQRPSNPPRPESDSPEEIEEKIRDLQKCVTTMLETSSELEKEINAVSKTLEDAKQKLASIDAEHEEQVRQIESKWDPRIKALQREIDIGIEILHGTKP